MIKESHYMTTNIGIHTAVAYFFYFICDWHYLFVVHERL